MPSAVGIGNLSLYVPSPKMDVDTVVRNRTLADPRLNRHLQRAVRVTGQEAIRFPEPWQDSATLAAQAVYGLVAGEPDMDLSAVRHLAVGTESAPDMSKPVSSMVQGMLTRAGIALPSRMSSFQTQHACAGGTMALLSVSALLSASGRRRDSGIVACTDVARYDAFTTAEVTQGAGAVALLLEQSPRLIELDLGSAGYSSHDVDDFFRPVGSTVARVQGAYSMRCYEEALEEALLDHCERSGTSARALLEETDLFVLHTPFRLMPLAALTGLLKRRLGLGQDEAERFLESRGFQAALEPMGRIGNLYTGSMWAVLAFLLHERYATLGRSIVGRRVLFASYGSGSTMAVFSGTVAEQAPEVIRHWDLDRVFSAAREASFEEYEAWLARDSSAAPPDGAAPRPDPHAPAFYLQGIREDGYRLYASTPAAASSLEEDPRAVSRAASPALVSS